MKLLSEIPYGLVAKDIWLSPRRPGFDSRYGKIPGFIYIFWSKLQAILKLSLKDQFNILKKY